MRRVELWGKAPKKWDVCAPHSQGSAQRTNDILSLIFRSDSRNGLRRKPRTAHSLRLWIFLLLHGHTLAADVYVISLIASPMFRETDFYNLKLHFVNTHWVLVRFDTCEGSRLNFFHTECACFIKLLVIWFCGSREANLVRCWYLPRQSWSFTQNVLVLLTFPLFGSVVTEKPTWSGVLAILLPEVPITWILSPWQLQSMFCIPLLNPSMYQVYKSGSAAAFSRINITVIM